MENVGLLKTVKEKIQITYPSDTGTCSWDSGCGPSMGWSLPPHWAYCEGRAPGVWLLLVQSHSPRFRHWCKAAGKGEKVLWLKRCSYSYKKNSTFNTLPVQRCQSTLACQKPSSVQAAPCDKVLWRGTGLDISWPCLFWEPGQSLSREESSSLLTPGGISFKDQFSAQYTQVTPSRS